MSSSFPFAFVIADDNSVIALKHVESVNLARDEQDTTADVLRDDRFLSIKTTSGAEYLISCRKQIEILGKQSSIPLDPIDLRNSIFEKWVSFISRGVE